MAVHGVADVRDDLVQNLPWWWCEEGGGDDNLPFYIRIHTYTHTPFPFPHKPRHIISILYLKTPLYTHCHPPHPRIAPTFFCPIRKRRISRMHRLRDPPMYWITGSRRSVCGFVVVIFLKWGKEGGYGVCTCFLHQPDAHDGLRISTHSHSSTHTHLHIHGTHTLPPTNPSPISSASL